MLKPERIRELWENYSPTKGIESFARSVEDEVRKDDEALIRKMLEALESATASHELGILQAGEGIRQLRGTIAAARARLAPPTA